MKFLKVVLFLIAVLPLPLNAAEVLVPPVDNILIQETNEAKKLKIGFQFFKKAKVTIQVKDVSGYTLHREVVKSEGQYSKQFDFDKLPNGEYLIVLKDQIKEVIQPIVIEGDKIKVLDDLQKIIFNPSVRTRGNRLLLSLLMGAPATVEITLLEHTSNNEVFSETIEDNFKIERIYNTKKLKPGVYTLKIQTSFKTILKYVQI